MGISMRVFKGEISHTSQWGNCPLPCLIAGGCMKLKHVNLNIDSLGNNRVYRQNGHFTKEKTKIDLWILFFIFCLPKSPENKKQHKFSPRGFV